MIAISEKKHLTSKGNEVVVKWLGRVAYEESLTAMRDFANTRTDSEVDELWLLEHPRIYTQGTACDLETFIPSDIPVIKTDRGGQITYHGPGQIVMYPLLKLKIHDLGVKSLVQHLEQAAIDVLAARGINSSRKDGAPGVYVNQAKLAALGLRIRRGTSYHGLSFNVGMDLTPFNNIDPCGYQGLEVTQLRDLGVNSSVQQIGKELSDTFLGLI
ncbi:MAG: lipoyl(octanoyl) transferase LipB [Gammaproteobacteria bacterium]|nr:lipoyl(octanoyl) transferase LipB [Gammaproteobacteria bacterium]